MILLSAENLKGQDQSVVQIIRVECPRCNRQFRTVPTVVEHTGSIYCPQCGARMNISEPMPVTVLSRARANAA